MVVMFLWFSEEISLLPTASWDQNGITVAGWANGTYGSSLSQLDSPLELLTTSNDVMHICARINHRIVVVHLDSTMNSFTIGSGRGFDLGQLSGPIDAISTNTSLYVLDSGNFRVQKLSLNRSDIFSKTLRHVNLNAIQ